MTVVSNEELTQCFQTSFPCDFENLAEISTEQFPGDNEALIETEKYKGKIWDEVTIELLNSCYDIPLLFNPTAFHYYFPAFIKLSQIEIEKSDLLVDLLISLLADSCFHWPESLSAIEDLILNENPQIQEALYLIDEEKLNSWRKERLQLFTRPQWELILKWLNWINENKQWEVDRSVLCKAIQNASKWSQSWMGSVKASG
jgi:hypothetical protein